jgi:hypothetical protein
VDLRTFPCVSTRMPPWRTLVLTGLCACHAVPSAESPAAAAPSRGQAAVPFGGAAPTPAPAGWSGGTVVMPRRSSRGVAHYGQITEVAVTSDGSAVLSRDATGGLRLWPAIDGTAAPRAIAIAAPAQLSIERGSGGLLGAVVDGSAAGHLVTLDASHQIRVTGLPIDPAIQSLTVVPGARRVLAVRADQSLALFDDTGAPLGSQAVRGGRITKVLVGRDGPHLAALVTRTVKGTETVELVPVTVDHTLELGTPVGLPALAGGAVVAAALSDRGTHVAYVGFEPGKPARLVIADARTGAEVPVTDAPAIPTPQTTQLGWTADNRLYVESPSGRWRIELGATAEVFAAPRSPRATLAAFGHGVLVGGYGAHLVIQRGDEPLRFLGYEELAPVAASIAPSGKVVMWVTATGTLIKETLDGSAPDVTLASPHPIYGSVAAVDDHLALAGQNTGVVALVDLDHGKELASLAVSSSTPLVQYSPRRKVAAVLAQTGAVWLFAVDPTAGTLGKPTVVADGAQSYQLLDHASDDAELLTYDQQWKGRLYTPAELAGPVSGATMKKDRFAGPASAYAHDRAGLSYVVTGADVVVYRQGVKVRTIKVGTAVRQVSPSPDGTRLAVSTQSSELGVYDASGKALWASGLGSFAYGAIWSEDGNRLAVPTRGGGVVLDAATGEPVAQSCGWRFTIGTQVPQTMPQNVPAICR